MKITVTDTGHTATLDVSEDIELENFKALCAVELQLNGASFSLYLDGKLLDDAKKSLKELGIREHDLVLARTDASSTASTSGGPMDIDFSTIRVPPSGSRPAGRPPQRNGLPDDPAAIREQLLNDPGTLAVLKERNPPLAEALTSGSLEKFTAVFNEQMREKNDKERRYREAAADPFTADAQKIIEQHIQEENINAMLEQAVEHNPEVFAHVTMLYISCKVNGHPIKAFVDSGAQSTIISVACAERCNIMRLMDKRFAGIAKGVGTQKILGKIHMADLQIENDFLTTSFIVLQDQSMDMLLGLDMLKRHLCNIDLKNNVLRIGDTIAPFLPESELPDNFGTKSDAALDDEMAEALKRSQTDSSAAGSSSGQGHRLGGDAPGSPKSAQSVSGLPEGSIRKLMEMGFPRQEAVSELQKCKGDVDAAAMALLTKSIPKIPMKK